MISTPTTNETAEAPTSRWVEWLAAVVPVALAVVLVAAAEYWRTAPCTGARSMRTEAEVNAFMLDGGVGRVTGAGLSGVTFLEKRCLEERT